MNDQPTQPDTALDMSNEKDRGLVRTAASRWRKRWPGMTDNVKNALVSSLVQANEVAVEALGNPAQALDAAKVIASIVKTGVAIDSLNHADEQAREKVERLDQGKATENVGLIVLRPERMR